MFNRIVLGFLSVCLSAGFSDRNDGTRSLALQSGNNNGLTDQEYVPSNVDYVIVNSLENLQDPRTDKGDDRKEDRFIKRLLCMLVNRKDCQLSTNAPVAGYRDFQGKIRQAQRMQKSSAVEEIPAQKTEHVDKQRQTKRNEISEDYSKEMLGYFGDGFRPDGPRRRSRTQLAGNFFGLRGKKSNFFGLRGKRKQYDLNNALSPTELME